MPKESHESSGAEAEATVKQMHGLVSELREAVQHRIGTELLGTHPVPSRILKHGR